MMDWFYEKDGVQQGPVSEAVLQSLVQAGTLGVHDLVWREGLADWSPYGSVFVEQASDETERSTLRLTAASCPTCGASVAPADLIPAGEHEVCLHCRETYVQELKEEVSNSMLLAGGRGTGGATPNRELRAMAREALSGNWLMAVVVTFLNILFQQVSTIIPFFGMLIQWAIVGPLLLGYHACFTGLVRGEVMGVGILFSGFSRFLKGMGLYLMTALIVGLASIAAALPGSLLIGSVFMMDVQITAQHPLFFFGIVVAILPAIAVGCYMYLRYSLVYFIVNDDPELAVLEVLKESTRRMDGHKLKLFWLFCSFIPWFLLGMLALFIGVFWTMAYLYAAFAAFYDDLGEQA